MKAKTVELHLLQSFPPSCVNRDGNNSPKDCTFGGARRARISSQCLKRAIREASVFEENAGKPAARSRLWLDELARDPRLTEKDDREILATLMTGLIGEIEDSSDEAVERDDPEKDVASSLRSKVLLHLPRTAGDAIIPIVTTHRDSLRRFVAEQAKIEAAKPEKGRKGAAPKNPHQKDLTRLVKELTAQLQQLPPSPDIALYGRMLAKNLGLNVEAAAQVAHAISTHKLSQEMDYWTAVDDFQPAAEPGAGMLGTAEFNASVFYRYACVNVDQLGRNLGEKSENGLDGLAHTRKTVQAFLLASYDAIPTGKLNGHAHFNPPFFALVAVRTKGMPLNLCNAFLDPVRAGNGKDIGAASADALLAHLQLMRAMVPVDEASYFLAHALPDAPAADRVKAEGGYAALVHDVMGALR